MSHSIGKTIATLRKEKGLTQAQLGEKLCVTDKAVSKWESENGLPETTILPKLAEVLGVSIDYLMNGSEDVPDVSTLPSTNTELSAEEQDKIIASVIHDGLINVDELLETKNYAIVKKAFETYPLHPFELEYAEVMEAQRLAENEKWDECFRYMLDHYEDHRNMFDVYSGIIHHRICGFSEIITTHVKKYPKSRNYSNVTYYPSAKELLEKIEADKQKILQEAAAKWDMETLVGELTEEYFRETLAQGNHEMVIIKLCKRMETVFRGKYHYEGDLNEMLNCYCSQYGREDDGWGYMIESPFVKYLHKLRKQRNAIVHSDNETEAMTEKEIIFCIEYICQKI